MSFCFVKNAACFNNENKTVFIKRKYGYFGSDLFFHLLVVQLFVVFVIRSDISFISCSKSLERNLCYTVMHKIHNEFYKWQLRHTCRCRYLHILPYTIPKIEQKTHSRTAISLPCTSTQQKQYEKLYKPSKCPIASTI